MTEKIRVAILEDHLATSDGYVARLSKDPDIEIVAQMLYSEELEKTLEKTKANILLLDVSVPISANNPTSFPILHVLPKLKSAYPQLAILVFSMHNQKKLIQMVMKAGASGYVLKDDHATIRELAAVVRLVASGGIHLSPHAYRLFVENDEDVPENSLSERQLEALSLAAAFPNENTTELAQRLNVAPSTTRNLLSGAYSKLNVNSRSAAIAKARQLGILPPEGNNFPAIGSKGSH